MTHVVDKLVPLFKIKFTKKNRKKLYKQLKQDSILRGRTKKEVVESGYNPDDLEYIPGVGYFEFRGMAAYYNAKRKGKNVGLDREPTPTRGVDFPADNVGNSVIKKDVSKIVQK